MIDVLVCRIITESEQGLWFRFSVEGPVTYLYVCVSIYTI